MDCVNNSFGRFGNRIPTVDKILHKPRVFQSNHARQQLIDLSPNQLIFRVPQKTHDLRVAVLDNPFERGEIELNHDNFLILFKFQTVLFSIHIFNDGFLALFVHCMLLVLLHKLNHFLCMVFGPLQKLQVRIKEKLLFERIGKN